jgi:6-phosphogluconolactonase
MSDLIMRDIEAFADGGAWADACADRLATALTAGLETRGAASLACSGGSTPAPIYRRLGAMDLDWRRIVVTLVDERHVPEASERSNARLVGETLMAGRAGAARFIPLHHTAITVDRAALMADHALSDAVQVLDAVLLGMGEDGHFASIFPGSPMLQRLLDPTARPSVVAVSQGRDRADPPEERISLNLSWLEQASYCALAIIGAAKRDLLARAVGADPEALPISALLEARAGRLDILWTEAAS